MSRALCSRKQLQEFWCSSENHTMETRTELRTMKTMGLFGYSMAKHLSHFQLKYIFLPYSISFSAPPLLQPLRTLVPLSSFLLHLHVSLHPTPLTSKSLLSLHCHPLHLGLCTPSQLTITVKLSSSIGKDVKVLQSLPGVYLTVVFRDTCTENGVQVELSVEIYHH